MNIQEILNILEIKDIPKDIKALSKQRRKIMKKYHTDLGNDGVRASLINSAYDELSNMLKKIEANEGEIVYVKSKFNVDIDYSELEAMRKHFEENNRSVDEIYGTVNTNISTLNNILFDCYELNTTVNKMERVVKRENIGNYNIIIHYNIDIKLMSTGDKELIKKYSCDLHDVYRNDGREIRKVINIPCNYKNTIIDVNFNNIKKTIEFIGVSILRFNALNKYFEFEFRKVSDDNG